MLMLSTLNTVLWIVGSIFGVGIIVIVAGVIFWLPQDPYERPKVPRQKPLSIKPKARKIENLKNFN